MKYTFKFNWFEVLFYSFFVTYGFFGLMTKLGAEKNLLQLVSTTIVLAVIQALFGYLAHLKLDFANESFSLSRKDLVTFGGLFLFLLIVVSSQLNWALYIDELSYAGAAHIHGINGLLSTARFFTFLNDVPFKYLVQVFSFCLLVGLVFIIWLTRKFSWTFKILSVVSLLILGRFGIYALGGNGSPHPSFELVMPFVFGAIFGLTHISLKLSYFFSVIVFLFFSLKKMQQLFSGAVLYLAVLAIGTIPLLLHMSTIVEHSVWAGLAISYVFIEMLTNEKLPYFRLVCIVSLATMMRQPCFIALVPVGIHFILTQRSVKGVLGLLAPTLFFIPFIGKSIIYGTPATQTVAAINPLLQLQTALKSSIVFVSAANSVNLWWLVFIPMALLPWRRNMRGLWLCFCSFAMAAFVVFYSIHPSIWGHAKYQIEFVVPLSIAGFLLVLNFLYKIKGSFIFVVTGLTALCGSNIYAYLNLQNMNRSADELVSLTGILDKKYDAGYRGLATLPFNYKEAFSDIQQLKLKGHTLVAGGSYGIFQEILGGYTLSEALMAHQIYKDQHNQIYKVLDDNSVDFDAEKANSDTRINAILMGPIPLELKLEAIKKLQNLGWKSYKTYSNSEFGSSLTLMLR